jgi:hypothetical protein
LIVFVGAALAAPTIPTVETIGASPHNQPLLPPAGVRVEWPARLIP